MAPTTLKGMPLWRPDNNGGATAERQPGRGLELPVTRLAITYVLLVPLVIFAVHGGFSFEHAAWNSDLGAFGGKIAVVSAPSETLRESIQSWVAMALCLLAAAPYCRSVANVCRRMPLMLSLPLYAIASACWSQDAGVSLRSGITLLVTTLFSFYLASRFSQRQQMKLVILTGACVAAASIALALFWPQFGVDHQLHKGAWQGLFTQKNACAEAMLFLLTPALALPVAGRLGQCLRALYILLCLFLIFMSHSRTGWAMTLFYLAFASGLRAFGRFERKAVLPLGALLLVIAGGATVIAIEDPSLTDSLISPLDGLSGRAQIWNAVTASILRRPLGGYGFDAVWSLMHGEASRIFAAAGWIVTGAHNGFLNVGLELGVVGLVLVVATFAQAFRHASAVFYPGHSSYIDWCIGIVFLTLAYNLDERTLMATQYLPWILYIVACTALSDAVKKPERGMIAPLSEAWA